MSDPLRKKEESVAVKILEKENQDLRELLRKAHSALLSIQGVVMAELEEDQTGCSKLIEQIESHLEERGGE